MVQEFQLSITPLGGDRHLVRAERVPPGVPLAEEQLEWPVERWLQQARQLMDDPMLSLLQAAGAGWPEDFAATLVSNPGDTGNGNSQTAMLTLTNLGQELYEALFQGSLRDSWLVAQGVAHHQHQVLRLRLGLRGDRLPRLPWEVMQAGNLPLATGTDVAFSRYRHGAVRALVESQRQTGEPVRILMAIAAPQDQETLSLYQETTHLQAELSGATERGLPPLELTILEQPGCEELTQALERGNFQIFHYAGHSNLSNSGGDLYLVNHTTGLTERLHGDDLAGLLANNGIQLAVLNSCRGADTVLADAETNNLAQALVRHGIPAVLAMAERIPDEVALTLTRLLYRNLDQGYPIDVSLSRARQGLIAAYGSHQLYWALPVLYQHPHYDGHWLDGRNDAAMALLDDPDERPLAALANAAEASRNLGVGRVNGTTAAAADATPAAGDQADAKLVTSILEDFSGHAEQTSAATTWATPAADSSIVELVEPPTQPLIVTTVPSASPAPPSRSRRLWWLLSALAGTGAIAGIAVAVALRSPAVQQALPSPVAAVLAQSEPLEEGGDRDLNEVSTERLTALAINQFDQTQWAEGAAAVAALLDRNALSYAQSALAAVPVEALDRPEIGFLRGRLAWQNAKVEANDDF
ncbi:MAG: CHAT domain-containing protein, partial [Spirulinaceae cyanobacterium RM2_2_10]|nr:CHAT domain-containing protein [Spirulinaceae cyanobacterium RM2_2_10]